MINYMEKLGTTAGFKNSYSYDRLIGLLVRMVMQPERCIVLGGTWRTPVAEGLQSKTFISDQKEEGKQKACLIKLYQFKIGVLIYLELTRKP